MRKKEQSRCAAGCSQSAVSRRTFLGASAGVVGATLLGGCGAFGRREPAFSPLRLDGPASKLRSRVPVAFVRRREEYGMWWPGAVYDGEAARELYTRKIRETAADIGMDVEIRPEPIYSLDEGREWVAAAEAAGADGLLVVLLDRQHHTWPTANLAMDSELPAVIYSPVGSSFTTNTTGPSQEKTGCVIYSTDDFSQPAYGLRMLHARAKMRATRILVVKGDERSDAELAGTGIRLRNVPASVWLERYTATPVDEEVTAIAEEHLRLARRVHGATRDDVLNGARAFVVARQLLVEEEADGITMDCLGAIGKHDRPESLPCLAWSRLNDSAVPAACEADLGAVASHVIVQYLFRRPGFQQDPVAETSRKAIIGAHCSCPTRLRGFDAPPEPFDLRHHHAERDATPHPEWRPGQAVTSVDVILPTAEDPVSMLISSGEVVENVSVPPAGGCVVSVMVRFDGVEDVLAYPGFHQVFFYGSYRDELVDFCRLTGIEAQVV